MNFAAASWSIPKPRQGEGALAIDHPKIDGFGRPTHLGRHLFEGNTVHLAGDPGVDVLVAGECLAQPGVAGKWASTRNSICE